MSRFRLSSYVPLPLLLALGIIVAVLYRHDATAQNVVRPTNMLYDATLSGNVLTLPLIIRIPATICENGTPFSGGWSTATGKWPAATCLEGTNVTLGVAEFEDGNDDQLQYIFRLPTDWITTIDLQLYWRTSVTTGNVVWQISTVCMADAETVDPVMNAVQTITDAAKGTTLQANTATLSSLTTTGCAAGELFNLKIMRNGAHASDTLSAAAQLIYAELTIRRAI